MTYKKALLLTLVVFVSLSASGCGYNTLTTKQQNVKGKWANVETQLQRRADLINNLVESAKLAGVQEQEVFGKIAEARSRLLNAQQQAPQGEAGRWACLAKRVFLRGILKAVRQRIGHDADFRRQFQRRLAPHRINQFHEERSKTFRRLADAADVHVLPGLLERR